MKRSRARRTALVTLVSAAIHAVLLALLAIGVPLGPSRTPEQPAIQVTLENPPPTPKVVQPRPPPKARTPPPIGNAEAPPQQPPPAIPPTQPGPPSAPVVDSSASAAMGDLARALRGSVGCSNPDAADLTEGEKEDCRRRLRAALPYAGRLSGLTAEKQARFDHASACDEAWRIYRATRFAPMPRLKDCPPWE